ncbi:MAG: hypothetical protein MR308_09895 [Lachnospiraceae bacterium]|nr:hypothetical protein [Lachnospiraceae bacterium]
MDKAEYREKLDEIKELAEAGDFDTAADRADDIEWRRVKSARTLCMVGEIYERVDRLEDCRKILEIAYKRSPDSKTVLYRLSELCIRLGDFDAALDYFTEFTEVSPTDNSKYILKYKLYRARKSPIEDQIEILERYKEGEFTEHWSYELAKLYSQAGNKEKCIEVCDDIILWFGEGKYVTKAMELKMQYTALSPSQQIKYQESVKKARAVSNTQSYSRTAASVSKSAPEYEQEKPTIRTEQAIEKMDMAASTAVSEESGLKMPYTGTISRDKMADPVRMQNQLADSIRQVFSGLNQRGTVPEAETFEFAEETDAVREYKPIREDLSGLEVKDLEPEQLNTEQTYATEVSRAVVKKTPADNGQIAGQMSLNDFAKPADEIDLEALFAETSSMLAKEVASGGFVKTDDSLENKLGAEDAATRKAAEEEAARKAAEAAQKAAEEEAARRAQEEAARKAAEEEAQRAEEETQRALEEAARRVQEEFARQAEEEEEAQRVAEVRRATEENACGAAEEAECEVPEEVLLYAKETDETLGLTREFNFRDELEKTRKAEDAKKAQETEDSLFEAELARVVAELQKNNLEEKPEEDFSDYMSEDIPDAGEVTAYAEEAPIVEQAVTIEENSPIPDMAVSDEDTAIIDEVSEFEVPQEEPQKTRDLSDLDEVLNRISIDPDEPKRLKYVPVEPRPLDEKEKRIFSYFSTIPGMSQQITEALADVHNNAGDKTSRSGNILLIGRQGSGKTRLCDAIVLAVCKDLGIEAAKVAKVIGRYFNQKDPAAVVSKLSGGFLIIEGAGELTKDTAAKLSQAMEFRTDSLVVMLEDEKQDLKNMLAKNPELAEKFTSSITIPVFTNDELVTFAKTYANEMGYKMDEMAVLALYTLIGDNQKDSEPVTVGKVKMMVDKGIERANKGTRKFGRKLSKKAMDDDNRIILYEKDFDFEIV